MRAFHEIDIAGTYNASRPSNVVVRNDFRSTAFWQPDVVTNKDGKATVKVKYPDSTTSLKATARAATSTNQFGIGEGTMRTINREFLKDGTNEIRIARKSGKGALYFAANAQFFSREESIKAAGNEIFVKREYYKLVGRPTLLKGYVYDKVKLTEGESALRIPHSALATFTKNSATAKSLCFSTNCREACGKFAIRCGPKHRAIFTRCRCWDTRCMCRKFGAMGKR